MACVKHWSGCRIYVSTCMCVCVVCVCVCVVSVCMCVCVCACLCVSFPRYIFYTVERDLKSNYLSPVCLHSVLGTVGRSLHVYVRACAHAYACISSSIISLPTCVQYLCLNWYANSSDYLYVSSCRHMLICLLGLPVCIFSLYAHVDTSTPLITCIYLLPNVACVIFSLHA